MTTPVDGLPTGLATIIPRPLSVQPAEGVFTLSPQARITFAPTAGGTELVAIAGYLAEILRPATDFSLMVAEDAAGSGDIHLSLTPEDTALGAEGYILRITPEQIQVVGNQAEGVFRGVQSLRQVFPPAIESRTRQPGPWQAPAGTVRDIPRFAWRGMMLDVARHFFGVEDVKRVIDLLAAYKLNRLHLHLSDDQGWRIMIHSWPELARYGGSSAVGGDPGGYYTQEDYAALVEYARARYITIVPEIDLPGHTNSALAAYAELNCDDKAPALYTGTRVGFSSLCTSKEITYQFLDDVIGELARLTPGAYFHIGGDEAQSTQHTDYVAFVTRVQEIVERHGKIMVGWDEISAASLHEPYITQFWQGKNARQAVNGGAKLILSPASRTYLDMQYTSETPLGLNWAGLVEVKDAYDWDPVTFFPEVTEGDVLGVEAPLWTETIRSMQDIEFMVFPRLLGIAELGWSPATGKDWDEYRLRLAAHGLRLQALGVHFYRSPQVPWP